MKMGLPVASLVHPRVRGGLVAGWLIGIDLTQAPFGRRLGSRRRDSGGPCVGFVSVAPSRGDVIAVGDVSRLGRRGRPLMFCAWLSRCEIRQSAPNERAVM